MNRPSPSRLGSSRRLFPAALLLASLGPALPGAAADSTWSPTSGFAYWDGPTSWSAGQPGAGDLAAFISGGTSNAMWGAGTGDTTTEDLTVDATEVTFLSLFAEQAISVGNGQPAIKTYTVTDDVRIENGGVLTLGRVNEALHLNVGDQLQVTGGGAFNARFGSDVSAGGLFVATLGSGSGTATIDGAGTTLDVTGATSLGTNGSTGTLAFINNADNNVLGDNLVLANSFTANSAGVLNITGGSSVTHTAGVLYGAIQGTAGQSATILVDGSGSEFISQSSEQMLLGSGLNSTATLTVSNGGSFTSTSGETRVFATGTIDLQGGTYTSTGDLSLIGGTFNQSGGFFNLAAGRTLSASNNAQINLTGGGSFGGGSYDIDDGTTFDLSGGADLTTGNFLDIGNESDGTLLVDGAGTTVTTNTTITGFTWFIGQGGGHGTVTLSNGASFTANDQMRMASGGQAGTAGTLDILSGATMSTDGARVASDGGPGTAVITVDGAGSALTITADNTLTVGNTSNGSATINLTNGGTLNTGTGLTTLRATAVINATEGTLNVNGDLLVNGASLTIDGFFSLADGATAFTATNDAQVLFDYGWSIDGGSTYRVEGGADLVMGSLLLIGAEANPGFSDFGDGTLIIDGDGSSLDYGNQLGADPLFIADAPGVSGTLTVQNGAAATIGSDILFLSLNGDAASSGTINILSGATMTTNEIQVATGGAGTGTINIDGGGSFLTLNEDANLTVGNTGIGAGTINLTGGILDAGTGLITVNATGTINLQGGDFRSDGTITLDGGAFNFDSGDLRINRFEGDLVNVGGELGSRGSEVDGARTATITGDYSQQAGGLLNVSIADESSGAKHSRFVIEGDANLGGTLRVTLNVVFGTFIEAGDRIDVLDWGTLSGTFDSVQIFVSDIFGFFRLGLNLTDLYHTGEISFDLEGDANADGLVGIEDLDILLANWGDSVNPYDWSVGDLTGDGLVGSADLAVVQAHWGDGVFPDVNIPEPGSLALLGLGGLAVLRRRR